MNVQVTLPRVDSMVLDHHERANAVIEAMSPSRSYGAETNLSSWRRHLSVVNPDGTDGYAFPGHNLRPGAEASLPVGALILSVDSSWAKARWYAGQYMPPLERWATLYVVEDSGLQQVMTTNSRRWASEVLGFLATNQVLCERAGVCFGQARGNAKF